MLKLSADLKTEEDKTTMDKPSQAVIRKASKLEREAHHVKEESKRSVASK